MNDGGIRKTIAMIGDKLGFEESKHVYTYEGKEFQSVTSVFKEYFPFDAPLVAQELIDSRHPTYKDMTVQQVLDTWKGNADYGTAVHKFCEDFLGGKFVSIENEHMVIAHKYLNKQYFEDVITEVRIAAPEFGIAGTIDALVKINGKWYIYDWKTDAKIRTTGFIKKDKKTGQIINDGKCTGLLAGFENCNYVKYAFQLGLYRLILETFYDIPIAGMVAVHFDEKGATEYVLPYHIDYIGMVLESKQKSTNPSASLQKVQ